MNHEESQEQQAVIAWSKYFNEMKWLFAIPNGAHLAGEAKQRAIQVGVLKKEGMKAGVADLCLPVPRNGKHGMFIEMKRKKGGKLSADQKQFLSDMASAGYHAVVCHGADEAIEEITEYMDLRRKHGK